MAKSKPIYNTTGKLHPKPQPTKKTSIFGWLMINLAICLVGVMIFKIIVSRNTSYTWLWDTYTENNIINMKTDKTLPPDQRIAGKLGIDYSFMMMLKENTPANAVIYYPSKADFEATPKYGPKYPFRASLVDKMSAIRFLYPRKIVVREEMGKTPYTDKLTHIGIVNGQNTDKLKYPVDSTVTHTVLPVELPTQNTLDTTKQ